MQITKEMARYVGELSRISLDEEETEKMEKELSAIVGYMEVLNSLDTDGVEPLSHVFPMTNVMRADTVKPSCQTSAIMENVPAEEDDMPVVPRTID